MLADTKLKQFPEMFKGETKAAKAEVEKLQGHLKQIDLQLHMNLTDDKNLSRKISDVQKTQKSFRDRIEKAAKDLKHYKSILASFQS